MEGQNAIKHNVKVDLSVQELIDCSKGNYGCRAGRMDHAYNYVKDNGIANSTTYPYRAEQNECLRGRKGRSNVKLTGFRVIPHNETALQSAVGEYSVLS